MILAKKRCLLTNEEFIPKRHNQLYANRKAQIFKNNEKARIKRMIKNPVDKVLDNNRSILKRTLGNKNEVIKTADWLLGAGFDFRFFCQSAMIKDKRCQIIYEFYITSEDNKYIIKKL
jgi:hypothetical protein